MNAPRYTENTHTHLYTSFAAYATYLLFNLKRAGDVLRMD